MVPFSATAKANPPSTQEQFSINDAFTKSMQDFRRNYPELEKQLLQLGDSLCLYGFPERIDSPIYTTTYLLDKFFPELSVAGYKAFTIPRNRTSSEHNHTVLHRQCQDEEILMTTLWQKISFLFLKPSAFTERSRKLMRRLASS